MNPLVAQCPPQRLKEARRESTHEIDHEQELGQQTTVMSTVNNGQYVVDFGRGSLRVSTGRLRKRGVGSWGLIRRSTERRSWKWVWLLVQYDREKLERERSNVRERMGKTMEGRQCNKEASRNQRTKFVTNSAGAPDGDRVEVDLLSSFSLKSGLGARSQGTNRGHSGDTWRPVSSAKLGGRHDTGSEVPGGRYDASSGMSDGGQCPLSL
ncbi:hypothetical protein RHMOL_Rhmol01G0213000 [Rhododendron molle]|uniref:Uncharacterized protein n=1 Tax=Rhododendron molle TaxID=49168 RepID=A0ACC0Q3K2_RHOML|nr:hypothetical protein RHMOL_Rhmol01G0213000 [Rhododendron molle]